MDKHQQDHEASLAATVPQFVGSFAGLLGQEFALGRPTGATAQFEGRVVVCGRPFSDNASPIRLDPDAHRSAIESELRRLDGWFRLVAIGRDKAVVATDLLGTGGAYLSHTRRGTIVASSLGRAAALVDDLEYDIDGAVAALTGSIMLAGKTPFQGIHRLQAGEYAVIDLAGGGPPSIRSYQDPAEALVASPGPPGDPDELMRLIRSAVKRESPDAATGLLLTAGKDSRAIGHALTQEDRTRVTAFTYGGWRSADRRLSAGVAQRLGLRHKRVGPLALNLSDESDLIVRSGGGAVGLQVSQHLAGVSALPGHVERVLTGYLGDFLSGKPWPETADAEWKYVQTRHRVWLNLAGVNLTREFPDSIERVLQLLRERMNRYSDLPFGRAGRMVDLTTRQATYIGGAFTLMHELVDTMTPFFNRAVMRYLLSRPGEDMAGQRLYLEMLDKQEARFKTRHVPPIASLSSAIDRRKGRYMTVNWRSVLNRDREWLRGRLAPFAAGDRFADLGIQSLDTEAELPLALFALPLVETRHQVQLKT